MRRIYLQNEDAVTFSVRDRFCLVGMRPILYLMWKRQDQYKYDTTKLKNCIPEQNVSFDRKTLKILKYNAESYKYEAGVKAQLPHL